MTWVFLFVPVAVVLALGFAAILARGILRRKEGTPKMQAIAEAVREGATEYMKRQYSVVSAFFGVVFVILLLLAFLKLLPWPVPFAFLSGGFFSGFAGFIGLKVSTHSSARTAHAAGKSLNQGLKVAFSSGMVMGLIVVGLALFDLSVWYTVLNKIYAYLPMDDRLFIITITMINFGMGASFQALFGVKSRRAFPRMIPATRRLLPTAWVTTWATWPGWAPTFTNPTTPRSLPAWHLPSQQACVWEGFSCPLSLPHQECSHP
jgi:Na+/H+-translocating membrane pyrophosphatase